MAEFNSENSDSHKHLQYEEFEVLDHPNHEEDNVHSGIQQLPQESQENSGEDTRIDNSEQSPE